MIKTTIGELLAADAPLAKVLLRTDPETGQPIKMADGRIVQRELPAGLAYDLGMLRRAMAPHIEEYSKVEAEVIARSNARIAKMKSEYPGEDVSEEIEKKFAVAQAAIVAETNKELLDLQGKEVELEHSRKIKLSALERAKVTIGVYDMEALMWLLEV